MLKEIISQGDFAVWPQISLLLFFAVFVGLLVWVTRRKAASHYRHMAEMVLEDDSPKKERRHDQA